jgi:signal transduction histidine kinase
MDAVQSLIRWFAGGSTPYMTLYHCMSHDVPWIVITIVLDLSVAAGYSVIAYHWWKNQRYLPASPAKRALRNMRNIFLFCGICGYLFIPIKMFWPAWRLYDLFLVVLTYSTWKYAWNARELKVVYSELGRSIALQTALVHSREESASKTRLLNALSHDLRTPLNSLSLHCGVIEHALAADDVETVRASLGQIRHTTQSAADMLTRMLECAHTEYDAVRPEPIDLADLVRHKVEQHRPAAEAKGVTLRGGTPASLVIQSDKTKLVRVLDNLIDNAIKYTPKGSVRVEIEVEEPAVHVHVIDTGVGIQRSDMAKLFEEFFQLGNPERDKRKGFGLGLATARRLARALGGDIVVESSPGKGSRFTLSLPLSHAHDDTGVHDESVRSNPASAAAAAPAAG